MKNRGIFSFSKGLTYTHSKMEEKIINIIEPDNGPIYRYLFCKLIFWPKYKIYSYYKTKEFKELLLETYSKKKAINYWITLKV